jgi:hypothetical protein
MNTPWCADELLELERVERRSGFLGGVAVVNWQRIVGKRDTGDVGVRQQQFLGGERGKPHVV